MPSNVTPEMIEAARKAYHDTQNGYQWFLQGNNFNETIAAMVSAALSVTSARILSALKPAPAVEYEIGIYGKAYDAPGKKRAYTYSHQPDNQPAWRLGKACVQATLSSAGDYIDSGLGLLKALEDNGFGVFEIAAAPTSEGGESR